MRACVTGRERPCATPDAQCPWCAAARRLHSLEPAGTRGSRRDTASPRGEPLCPHGQAHAAARSASNAPHHRLASGPPTDHTPHTPSMPHAPPLHLVRRTPVRRHPPPNDGSVVERPPPWRPWAAVRARPPTGDPGWPPRGRAPRIAAPPPWRLVKAARRTPPGDAATQPLRAAAVPRGDPAPVGPRAQRPHRAWYHPASFNDTRRGAFQEKLTRGLQECARGLGIDCTLRGWFHTDSADGAAAHVGTRLARVPTSAPP